MMCVPIVRIMNNKDKISIIRDPSRIDKILGELSILWKGVPDWRLGQLIYNLSVSLGPNANLFYMEDEDLLKQIQIYKELEGNPTQNSFFVTLYARKNAVTVLEKINVLREVFIREPMKVTAYDNEGELAALEYYIKNIILAPNHD